MSTDGRIFIEKAAELCFQRASQWKDREQYALESGCVEMATMYSNFCDEADMCKSMIRTLSSLPQEIDVIKQIINLVEILSVLNPSYIELKILVQKLKPISEGRTLIV